eukprot:GDKK01024057.1.p1 GENE.GDKK01024057.1~~GDKK01024057.1.p1  ORF type:complete len:152 (-),score=0.76 GDKK01024057.1:50-505(-)
MDIVRAYILGTHGSLPLVDYASMGALLAENFVFLNEEQLHDKAALLGAVFPGWSSIVDGVSSVRIHSICTDADGRTVLAHWETDYDCKDGSVWYGTDVDISGKKVRGFQVFASFTIDSGKISRIVQRSDTVTKKLGVDDQVQAYKRRQAEL